MSKVIINVVQQFDADNSDSMLNKVVYRYVVKSVRNRTYPTIGEILSREQVKECIIEGCEVNIT
jgi:hypothetical protein